MRHQPLIEVCPLADPVRVFSLRHHKSCKVNHRQPRRGRKPNHARDGISIWSADQIMMKINVCTRRDLHQCVLIIFAMGYSVGVGENKPGQKKAATSAQIQVEMRGQKNIHFQRRGPSVLQAESD